MQFSLKRVLCDGTILSVLISIIVYGSIYVNPTMWIGDYPPDIQEAVGPVDVFPCLLDYALFGALRKVRFSVQEGGVAQRLAPTMVGCTGVVR